MIYVGGTASASFPGRNGLILVSGSSSSPPCVVTATRTCDGIEKSTLIFDTLYLVNLAAGTAQRLASLPKPLRDDAGPSATFSPDGSKIAFGSSFTPQPEALFTVAARSGASPVSLGARGATPAWAPDGRRIAYAVFAHGQGKVRALDAETRASITLARGTRDADLAGWAPRGGLLLEMYPRIGAFSPPQTHVSWSALQGLSPAWSPHGTRVIFFRVGGGMWVGCLNGRGLQQITAVGSTGEPIWSPDGRKIALVVGAATTYIIPAHPARPLPESSWTKVIVNGFADDWQPVPPAPPSTPRPVCT